MICIAAFIVLLVIWLFVPVMKLVGFKKQAKTVNTLFKKSIHCFSRRVTLQVCDSSFKDDIKNSILRKVIVKHKKWVKPISVAIEATAWLIVIVSVVSLVTVVKSGLAYIALGSCDVQKPAACSLSTTEACTIDSVSTGNPVSKWFDDWGEIFRALPAKFTHFNAQEFIPDNSTYYGEFSSDKTPENIAVDIFDPGCTVCRRSFVSQKKSGFTDKYKVYLMPYVIRGNNGDKFTNSQVIAEYIEAVRGAQPQEEDSKKVAAEWIIMNNIFTDKAEDGVVLQEHTNGMFGKKTENEVITMIHGWLHGAGFTDEQLKKFDDKSKSSEVKAKLDKYRKIVETQIMTKRIPTMIYNGKRHEGLFKPTDKF